MSAPPSSPPPVGRFLGPQGRRAVVRTGLPRQTMNDLYHALLTASWPRLVTACAVLWVAVNAFFALLYVALGDGIEHARPGSFVDAFFFSVQTLATIGYGQMAPRTVSAHILVSVEALAGVLGFALVAGLTFAKFSRPTARVLFSRVAVVAPRDGVVSLMFRMANARGNQIVEAEIHVALLRTETTAEGETVRRFYNLELARARTPVFILTWSAVHPITEHSPLHGATPESLAAMEAEIVVSLVGLDASFSQTIHARHSYLPSEVIWNARFVDIMSRLADGRSLVDYARFHEVAPGARTP